MECAIIFCQAQQYGSSISSSINYASGLTVAHYIPPSIVAMDAFTGELKWMLQDKFKQKEPQLLQVAAAGFINVEMFQELGDRAAAIDIFKTVMSFNQDSPEHKTVIIKLLAVQSSCTRIIFERAFCIKPLTPSSCVVVRFQEPEHQR